MIRYVQVEHFQKLVRLDIDFDPCVTTVIGESDQGKSSLLRALRWACCNSIRGDDFISWGYDSCEVVVGIDDGEVIRRAGKTGNQYQLNDDDPFKSFRDGVPDEIAKLLNLDDALNFQGQHDPPFWFMASSGEVSRELNKIVNLERIDEVLSRCAGEVRRSRASLQVNEQRLQEACEERDRLAWVEQACTEYQQIVSVQNDIALKRAETRSLREAIDHATSLESKIQNAAEAKEDARKAIQATEEAIRLDEQRQELTGLINKAEQSWERAEGLNQKRLDAQRRLERETRGTCPVCGGPLRF